MGNKIGTISIFFAEQKHNINVNNYDRTIGEIQEQLFSDFNLDKEFLKFYGLCINNNANSESPDPDKMQFLGNSIKYKSLTIEQKVNLRLVEVPLKKQMNQKK